jgi:hypothetical protein
MSNAFTTRARALTVAIAMTAALGLTAGSSLAAPKDRVAASVQGQSSAQPSIDCGSGGLTNRFVIDRAGGGKRTIDICNAVDDGNLQDTARALSLAMDTDAARSPIVRHPLMPELLGLRLMRSRAEVEPALSADTRRGRIAEIDRKIKKLEREISIRPMDFKYIKEK